MEGMLRARYLLYQIDDMPVSMAMAPYQYCRYLTPGTHMRYLWRLSSTQKSGQVSKDDPVANAGLAKMQTYGPWSTRKCRDIEDFVCFLPLKYPPWDKGSAE